MTQKAMLEWEEFVKKNYLKFLQRFFKNYKSDILFTLKKINLNLHFPFQWLQ